MIKLVIIFVGGVKLRLSLNFICFWLGIVEMFWLKIVYFVGYVFKNKLIIN